MKMKVRICSNFVVTEEDETVGNLASLISIIVCFNYLSVIAGGEPILCLELLCYRSCFFLICSCLQLHYIYMMYVPCSAHSPLKTYI